MLKAIVAYRYFASKFSSFFFPFSFYTDCGQPTVANGILLGDTFYEGSAIVNCDVGHEGGGMATCGSGGTWTTLPGCTAVGKRIHVQTLNSFPSHRGSTLEFAWSRLVVGNQNGTLYLISHFRPRLPEKRGRSLESTLHQSRA